MRTLLITILSLFSVNLFSQSIERINEIDSLVTYINESDFESKYDSLSQDMPQLGLSMKTYLTMTMEGDKLRKYINRVNSTRIENGMLKQITTSTSFYFDKEKLIKVEEFMLTDTTVHNLSWYYYNDKPLYYSLKNERAAERAKLLLTMADSILKQAKK